MAEFAQITLDGLFVGSSYALIALGFTLIFGTMRRLNLAYGATIMVGVYLAAYAASKLGSGGGIALVVTIVGAALAGLYVQRLCFSPFADRMRLASMVSSFAIWMQLEELVTLLLPSHSSPFPALFPSHLIALGGVGMRVDQIALLAIAVALAAGTHAALHWTSFGLGVRSVIDDPIAARIVGIPVERVLTQAFVLASVIGAGAAALIASSDRQVTAMFGMWALAKGLIAMMLGGLGSLPGAVVGGLALGVVEAHALALSGPQVRDLLAWMLLFAVLVLRPGGLMGGAHLGALRLPAGRA
jgi:branched-subunit amino acid ABC-type transport system permease component